MENGYKAIGQISVRNAPKPNSNRGLGKKKKGPNMPSFSPLAIGLGIISQLASLFEGPSLSTPKGYMTSTDVM